MTTFTCRALQRGEPARNAMLDRMMAEGLADTALYDTPAGAFREAWNCITAPETAWLVQVQAHFPQPDGQCCDTAAMAWLNNFTGRTAMLHFCVFRAFHSHAKTIGRHLLRWVFGSGHFDSLVGLTPAPYRHALRLAEAIGFTPTARVPGACHLVRWGRHVDGVLSICNPNDGDLS